MWDVLSRDPAAERVTLYPRDPATVENLFREISCPSLFSSTRLIVAHAVRPIKRTIPLQSLARNLSAIAPQTVLVMTAEGMTPMDEEMAHLLEDAPARGPRVGFEVAVWKPYNRVQLLDIAREILSSCGVRTEEFTLNFWLDRIGSNLDRLEAEAKRLKIQFPDGEITQERLEEIFEVPHVHDDTVWNALRHLVSGNVRDAQEAIEQLLQSSDVFVAASELSRALLCAQSLCKAASAPEGSASEIFLRFGVGGKRRQKKMMEIAALMGRPVSHPGQKLLALDLALKQTKTVSGRQEVLLKSLLDLCGNPQPTA